MFERELGPEHYEVAVTLNNLAAIAHRAGDASRADAFYRRALAIKQRLLGDDHPDVAVTLNNRAALLIEQERYDAAAALLRRALAIFERTLEPGHPSLELCRATTLMYSRWPRSDLVPEPSCPIRQRAEAAFALAH